MSGPADRFLGAWQVVEHVFDPMSCQLVGLVHQERTLEGVTLDDGREAIRVFQRCSPDDALRSAGHPMAAFEGEWVFDLVVDAPHRRYLGPDVVGSATQWAPGAIAGCGIWPRFGHTFESWSLLVHPERQLTGGWFHRAGRPVATIIGVAEPLGSTPGLPLEGPPSGRWSGTATAGDVTVEAVGDGPSLRIDGVDVLVGWQGVSCRYGPMLVADGWAGPTRHVRIVEIYDASVGEVLGILTTEADGSTTTQAVRLSRE